MSVQWTGGKGGRRGEVEQIEQIDGSLSDLGN